MEERKLPTPCNEEVEKYLQRWDSLENYVLQEKSLNKLFHELVPENDEIEKILIKASTLNDFYSTNIFSIFPVAKHILDLKIDDRLKKGDADLVSEIADVEISGKKKHFYSFATKYCSHHNANDYPIYDSYVEKVLMYYKKEDKFAEFKLDNLKDYATYKSILRQFANFYGIAGYGLKDLDRYLWQLGKKYFPKTYN